jgi:hypothetical protein
MTEELRNNMESNRAIATRAQGITAKLPAGTNPMYVAQMAKRDPQAAAQAYGISVSDAMIMAQFYGK